MDFRLHHKQIKFLTWLVKTKEDRLGHNLMNDVKLALVTDVYNYDKIEQFNNLRTYYAKEYRER